MVRAKKTFLIFLVSSILVFDLLGDTIFDVALKGDVETFNSLLISQKNGLNGYDDRSGKGLLLISFLNNDLKMFEHLLKLGADPESYIGKGSKQRIGEKIIEVEGKDEFLLLLIRYGMNPNLMVNVDLSSEKLEPLIYKTVRNMHTINYAILLLNSGADLNLSGGNGINLFQESVEWDNYRAALYLLRRSEGKLFNSGMSDWWESKLVELKDEQLGVRYEYWKEKLISHIEEN